MFDVLPPDDELPDYIMVMVANQKDVMQMSTDLELFLGDNAEPFTLWSVQPLVYRTARFVCFSSMHPSFYGKHDHFLKIVLCFYEDLYREPVCYGS